MPVYVNTNGHLRLAWSIGLPLAHRLKCLLNDTVPSVYSIPLVMSYLVNGVLLECPDERIGSEILDAS